LVIVITEQAAAVHGRRYLIEFDVFFVDQTKDICVERIDGSRLIVKIAAYHNPVVAPVGET
jgi:hypothetical protein